MLKRDKFLKRCERSNILQWITQEEMSAGDSIFYWCLDKINKNGFNDMLSEGAMKETAQGLAHFARCIAFAKNSDKDLPTDDDMYNFYNFIYQIEKLSEQILDQRKANNGHEI